MSLIETRVQDWRIKNPELDKNMHRAKEHGALDLFISQTDSVNSILGPEIKQRALNSTGATIKVPVIDYNGNVTIQNVRTCVIPDAENTSKLVTITFATFATGFTMVPGMYSNNDITYEHDWNVKIANHVEALAQALDVAAIAALEANKTQVFADPLFYTVSGNDLQATYDQRVEILGDLGPIFRANAYRKQIHIVGNTGIDSLINKLMEHGHYNDQNMQFQYADKIMHYTPNIANESGKFATGYAVQDGSVALLYRLDREAARGAESGTHKFGVTRLPMLNMPVGYHYNTEVGNWSGIAGESTADLTCAVKEFYGFSVDVAFIVAYNTDQATIAQPIIKFEIQSAIGNNMARPVKIVNDEDNPVYTSEVGTPV